MDKQIKIALAGNPNCGKTTLFNALTGSNQFVGNWPGVTVEKKEGKLKKHEDVVIMDLPGIYSLSPYTLEEVVARNYLIKERPDAILNIIDGTNLERNLYLTTQLTELGIPVVVAINMMDVVKKNGDSINTQELAREIHERFYVAYHDVTLPHKFKIAVGGCPNNCVKPDLNDLGIVGQRVPSLSADKCRGCGKCGVQEACPMAATVRADGKVSIDPTICNNCGRCAGKCPFGALETGEILYKVYVGGRWGKKVRMGSPLQKLFTREEVLNVVEKAILLFKSKGESGERFGQTVDRLGVEKVEKMLIADNLLKRKEEILEMETIGGAKC